MEVWPKKNDSPEQVEDVFFAEKLSTRTGFSQYTIEFVQLAFGYHVQVGSNLVALRVTDQIQV